MKNNNFIAALKKNWQKKNSLLCVGLDSEYDKLPQFLRKKYSSKTEAVLTFNESIIDNTADFVSVYKIQYAFYGALGEPGITALRKTVNYIHKNHPGTPVILDAKRNDVGNTAEAYAVEVFDNYGVDAVTVNPYMGRDSCEPFLKRDQKGVICLCRTSNPGARDFQDLPTEFEGKTRPLYQVIALKISREWNGNGNCCLVMGATYPEELKNIRGLVGDVPFLIPGIGVQGGDVEKTVKNGLDSQRTGMIIHSARGIIFASPDKDFAQAARREAQKLREEINKYRR